MAPAHTSSPDEVQVPEGALIECPLVRFDLRPASCCAACPKFAGLEDRFPGMEKLPFHKRYLILCLGEPVKRQVRSLVKE